MQLFKTTPLDSAIFIEKQIWRVDSGEEVKNGCEKKQFIGITSYLFVSPCSEDWVNAEGAGFGKGGELGRACGMVQQYKQVV
jgi:hypothetical protein